VFWIFSWPTQSLICSTLKPLQRLLFRLTATLERRPERAGEVLRLVGPSIQRFTVAYAPVWIVCAAGTVFLTGGFYARVRKRWRYARNLARAHLVNAISIQQRCFYNSPTCHCSTGATFYFQASQQNKGCS